MDNEPKKTSRKNRCPIAVRSLSDRWSAPCHSAGPGESEILVGETISKLEFLVQDPRLFCWESQESPNFPEKNPTSSPLEKHLLPFGASQTEAPCVPHLKAAVRSSQIQ